MSKARVYTLNKVRAGALKLKKDLILIALIILIGIIYRLIISFDNNFIFNMDNARDMVDVREMVVLHKIRLIGQTTSIDGVFYGPAWYYLLSIPFILTGGNPYGSILMEILLWAVGGYFLLILTQKYFGKLATIAVGPVWIASNFILLGSQYAFNPNPILFLTPVFIFSLLKFLETAGAAGTEQSSRTLSTKKYLYSLVTWFLAGIFLHFEVTVGLFMPLVIILTILLSQKKIFVEKSFWAGVVLFLITLLPQIIFDFRHSFFLTRSLLEYKSTSHAGVSISPLERIRSIIRSFYDTLLPTLENFTLFTNLILLIFPFSLGLYFKNHKKIENIVLIILLIVAVPLIGLIPLKVDLLRWYLNASIVGAIFLIGFVIGTLEKVSRLGQIIATILTILIVGFSLNNIAGYIQAAKAGDGNNSLLQNELTVVDYTYTQAQGKNFKVYVYMPSVIDYPYQYLYWWRGLKKYGFVPKDYAYLPNKPQYIAQKEKLNTGSNPPDSGLVFLIKEPDQIGQRHLWENSFKNLPLLSTRKIGSLVVETRQELTQPQ